MNSDDTFTDGPQGKAGEAEDPFEVGPADLLPVPISALRHYRFCPRRCALQYVEEQFVDNVYTLEVSPLVKRWSGLKLGSAWTDGEG
ncbi:MAG: hypothetical protein ACR2PL_10010 [Dehalococcoidia bacterium]